MPKYEYACRSCGEHIEVVQSFADAPLTECPACGGPLRKVFSPPGIAFKGSGFYRTDNRKRRQEPKVDAKADGGGSPESGTKTDGAAAGEPAKKEAPAASSPAPASAPASAPAASPSTSEAKPKAAEAKTA